MRKSMTSRATNVFYAVLEDPLGRHRFRDYLVSVGASTAELDMWVDLQHHAAMYQALQANAEALHGSDSLLLPAFNEALTLKNISIAKTSIWFN